MMIGLMDAVKANDFERMGALMNKMINVSPTALEDTLTTVID